MSAQKTSVFEYRDLTPQEKDCVSKLYGRVKEVVRVGPKGYYVFKPYLKHADDIYNMELREGDVFVASYQRSGTTWVQELVWLVANNSDYEKAAAVPLTTRYPFLELFMFFDDNDKMIIDSMIKDQIRVAGTNTDLKNNSGLTDATPATAILPSMPSPRFVKTHLPMSLLPPKITDNAKVVYVARDPRDVIVSCYHHAKLFKFIEFIGTFKDILYAFMNDLYVLTPYFEHVKEAWALRNHPNMLFLFYEELSKDMPASIRRVSNFLGKEITPKQMERLCNHLSFENFKNNESVNLKAEKESGFLTEGEQFIRKGKAGGWRDYFDEEMQQDVEKWIADNLRDSDLRFPSMEN